MELQYFYTLRKEIIEPYIEELLKQDECHCLTFHSNRIPLIYKFYEKKRLEIRKKYMKYPERPLDRHKIAAAMMYAILRSHVLSVNRLSAKGLPEKMLLANEYLALYVALNIVEMYKEDELGANYEIIIPVVYHKKENSDVINEFISNTCIGLYNLKKLKYFDTLAYSTILFMLEKYTDTLRENIKL